MCFSGSSLLSKHNYNSLLKTNFFKSPSYLSLITNINLSFFFNKTSTEYFRVEAFLGSFTKNIGIPGLIFGFDLNVKKRTNLDGFFFKTFDQKKKYSRLRYKRYTSFLLINSYHNSLYSNMENNVNFFLKNYYEFRNDSLDYFPMFFDNILSRNLLGINNELSDVAKHMQLFSDRFSSILSSSKFTVDTFISFFNADILAVSRDKTNRNNDPLNFPVLTIC